MDLSTWSEEDLRAGLAVMADYRKAPVRMVTAAVAFAWNEALHPRDDRGQFAVSGNGEGRNIVDRVISGMHDGMTQRSRATHLRIHQELNRAGLREHAAHYWNVYREHARNRRFVHPREAFGRANMRIHDTRIAAATEAPTPAPVAAPEHPVEHFFTGGDMGHRWQTHSNPEWPTVTTRELIQGVLRPGGGPAAYVRTYRNARNAGLSHDEILRAAADEANRLEPGRADPYTPTRVEAAIRDQYRAAGLGFTPSAPSYTVAGQSYEWGTRPPDANPDPMAPRIGRVIGGAGPRPEPSRPVGEPAPSGTRPRPSTPPIAGDERFIRGTGPAGSITSADRILAAHPTGGVNDQVQKLYERDLLKFQTAGGTLVFLKNGDVRFRELATRYNQNVAPSLSQGDERHRHGASFMNQNLVLGQSRDRGGSVIALDKDGNPVAAVGFSEMATELHVGVAGSTGRIPGAGMAMQWGLANIASEYGKSLGSSYLPDARPAHASWGRRITASGSSHWSKDDIKKIVAFRPAAPAIQKGA